MESYGFLSLLPPVLSIFLSIYTRNVILSLTAGALSGTLILSSFNPFFATVSLMRDHIFIQVANPSNSQVIMITLIIGGFVKLLEESGGAEGFFFVDCKTCFKPEKRSIGHMGFRDQYIF